jgi:dethiobiotin synthetase/adenosylmethionine--8-amino-7-oxononanoate aminotransferase
MSNKLPPPQPTFSGVTVVDARAGEDWLVFRGAGGDGGGSSSSSSSSSAASGGPALTPLYDAASSWWTQTAGPFADQGHVVRAAAAAAARYSHVMWPEVAHEPGLRLAEKLLQGPLGAGWAARVFYSDDGSTAVEVALKMAFRRYALDHGLVAAVPSSSSSPRNSNSSSKSSNSSSSGTSQPDEAAAAAPPALDVLALSNAYHGDTLGAMDCAAPSPFNGPLQTPWYSGRGLFLEPPYLSVRAPGRWTLKLPDWLAGAAGKAGGGDGGGRAPSWASQEEAFCPDRDRCALFLSITSGFAALAFAL